MIHTNAGPSCARASQGPDKILVTFLLLGWELKIAPRDSRMTRLRDRDVIVWFGRLRVTGYCFNRINHMRARVEVEYGDAQHFDLGEL